MKRAKSPQAPILDDMSNRGRRNPPRASTRASRSQSTPPAATSTPQRSTSAPSTGRRTNLRDERSSNDVNLLEANQSGHSVPTSATPAQSAGPSTTSQNRTSSSTTITDPSPPVGQTAGQETGRDESEVQLHGPSEPSFRASGEGLSTLTEQSEGEAEAFYGAQDYVTVEEAHAAIERSHEEALRSHEEQLQRLQEQFDAEIQTMFADLEGLNSELENARLKDLQARERRREELEREDRERDGRENRLRTTLQRQQRTLLEMRTRYVETQDAARRNPVNATPGPSSRPIETEEPSHEFDYLFEPPRQRERDSESEPELEELPRQDGESHEEYGRRKREYIQGQKRRADSGTEQSRQDSASSP